MGKTYTTEEVAELLTAYRLSNCGTLCVEETKREWKNSFNHIKEGVRDWLINKAYLTVQEKAEIWFSERDEFFQKQLLMKYPSVEAAYCATFGIRKNN